ncbi:MAG: ribosome small subunit-dependent GTPase A [Dorea sp.]|uniref:ribosome small subunit-dependent GTPase A n=1 Tax=Dorea sp. YH-dor226 TaxID=3151119 RepID=UPI00302C78F7|nr:ribosome small subunit-dependent GTPase A [Dorea sp.]
MKHEIPMKQYGLSESFEKSSEQFAGLTVARILSQEKGIYRLVSSQGEKLGEISGRFHYEIQTKSEYPAVGDFVMADWNENGGNAVIHHVLPRKSSFIRKAAGEKNEEQVVAANIDTVFLCMSLNQDFNLRRLERYVSIAWNSGALPVVVLTKSDLCEDPDHKLKEVSSVAAGVDILLTNAKEKTGYEQIYPYLTEGRTIAFIGSSGVGKSTLINCLLGKKYLDTNGLRNDDKGRHTTTHRELILLPSGGMVIDTPGMRELGMWDAGDGIDQTFSDIEELAQRCRFRNCTHSGREPGCAVQEAVEQGELSMDRLRSYQKLMNENRYVEDAEGYLAEKKQKFKTIAKINKRNRKG